MTSERFSEQLRRVIEECGSSRYELSRAAGVSEAALSRFLASKQGLTLTSLDRLAEVLGIVLTVAVQKIPRRKPRGRKPKKGESMTTATSIRWHVIALGCAKDAHENHFSSRRGVWHFEDLDVLVLYNNNPYAKLPNLRDEETAEFRRRLAAEGIQELGYATYPPPSETDDQEAEQFSRKMAAKGIKTIVHKGGGYTYALVIKAGRDREDWVVQTMNEILADSFKRLAVEE